MPTIKNKKLKIKSQKAEAQPATRKFKIPEYLRQPKMFVPLIIIVLVVLAFFLKGLFVAALVNGQPILRLTVIQE